MTRRRLTLVATVCLLAAGGGLALGRQDWQWQRRVSPRSTDSPPTAPAYRTGRSTSGSRTTSSPSSASSTTPHTGAGAARGRGGTWTTDWPDSDLNFSYRLQQLTSLKVNPVPITLRLTDEALFDYPFIYMLEVAALSFSEEEVVALRRYLVNGGFLMVDDFWGEATVHQLLPPDQARLPRTRAGGAAAHARDLPVRLPAQGEAAGPRHPGLGARLAGDLGGSRPRLARGPLPGDLRRQGPADGHHLPQHRPRRRLGAGRGRPRLFPGVLRAGSPTRWASTS